MHNFCAKGLFFILLSVQSSWRFLWEAWLEFLICCLKLQYYIYLCRNLVPIMWIHKNIDYHRKVTQPSAEESLHFSQCLTSFIDYSLLYWCKTSFVFFSPFFLVFNCDTTPWLCKTCELVLVVFRENLFPY